MTVAVTQQVRLVMHNRALNVLLGKVHGLCRVAHAATTS